MDFYLILMASFALFVIGIMGCLIRRNALIFFLCIEMMLNAANLLFVAFAYKWNDQQGLVWVFFVLVVAAVEAAVGLSISINLFRSKQSVDLDQYCDLQG